MSHASTRLVRENRLGNKYQPNYLHGESLERDRSHRLALLGDVQCGSYFQDGTLARNSELAPLSQM